MSGYLRDTRQADMDAMRRQILAELLGQQAPRITGDAAVKLRQSPEGLAVLRQLQQVGHAEALERLRDGG